MTKIKNLLSASQATPESLSFIDYSEIPDPFEIIDEELAPFLKKAELTIWELIKTGLWQPALLAITKLAIFAIFLVNTFVVSRLGLDEIKAMQLTTPLFVLVFSVIRSVISSAVLINNQHQAQNGQDKVFLGKLITHADIIAILLCLGVTPFYLSITKIFELTGTSSELNHLIFLFTFMQALALYPLSLMEAELQLPINLKKNFINIITSFIYGGLTAFSSWAFTLGKIGFPKIGVIGPPLAYLIGSVGGSLFLRLYYLVYRKEYSPYHLFKNLFTFWRIVNKNIFKQYLSLGSRLSLQNFFDTLVPLLTVFILNYLGSEHTLAIYAVGIMIWTILNTMTITAAISLTRDLGRLKNMADFRRLVGVGLSGLIGTTAVLTTGLCLGAEGVCAAMAGPNITLNPELLDEAIIALKLMTIASITNAIKNYLIGILKSTTDIILPTIATILFQIIIPLPITFLFRLILDLMGISMADLLNNAGFHISEAWFNPANEYMMMMILSQTLLNLLLIRRIQFKTSMASLNHENLFNKTTDACRGLLSSINMFTQHPSDARTGNIELLYEEDESQPLIPIKQEFRKK